MKTLRSIPQTRRLCLEAPSPVVMVPTMGALHAGHASLLEKARALAGTEGTVIASIFVNPTQFGPQEDLSRYPRPFAKDQAMCRARGVDLLFAPTPESMYPSDFSTWVEESSISTHLCGTSRPGHFRGVCTVVLKLFQICQPTIAVFGQKDFQQCAVIKRMVRDLHLPVKIVVAPTVREADGLALSSRNTYLSPEERAQAVVLPNALNQARAAFRAGQTNAASLKRQIQRHISTVPLARVDYIELIDGHTLQPVQNLAKGCVVAAAVFFGRTRLIDNILL